MCCLMLKATSENKTSVTSGNELTGTLQSSVQSYNMTLLPLHLSSRRAWVGTSAQAGAVLWKAFLPFTCEVPAAPEEPFSYHHPPPFSRIPTPTVLYLDKLLIQWMQLGWNCCTSGLFLPDTSLGHNTLLDKHCIFAGWTVLLQKPLKKQQTRKQQWMLKNVQVTPYSTVGIIVKKFEKSLGSWQGESFLLISNSPSYLQTIDFCQLLHRKRRSDFK